MTPVLIPVSIGEFYDKLSILEIKTRKLKGNSLLNVEKELQLLQTVLRGLELHIDKTLFEELRSVNEALWDIEDQIREYERNKDFGNCFIELARSVYFQNDLRASIKRRINQLTSSDIFEEKSYNSY